MSVRIKRTSTHPDIEKNPMYENTTQEQRETTVDGQTFHWAPNQIRNFLDNSVGQRHVTFASGNATGTVNTVFDRSQTGSELS